MHPQFDTDAEDSKLATLRESEEEDLTRILAEKYRIPYTDLTILPVNMDALRVISKTDAQSAQTIAFDKNGKHLSVALRSPETDGFKALKEKLEGEGFILEQYLMSQKSYDKAFERYDDLSYASGAASGIVDISGDALSALTSSLTSLPALRAFLMERVTGTKRGPVSEVLDGVLAGAYALKASDIHVEPEEAGARLRFRLDGELVDVFLFDPHTFSLLDSRIKLLSGLKLNVDSRAQDGRFSVLIGGTEIEVRSSLIPGNYGEAIVMRLLDPASIKHTLAESGMHPKLLERLRLEIKRPNGMILTTGPTGSGKTTTLYAFLQEVYTPGVKVITIEDPVEYHLAGIVQTQTQGTDYTFASGLRSVLRQDPDVIMVGEIRDAEVADVAIQAALTGHLVFSTLHTNNAAGAFPRLSDLGVDAKSFASAITVSMAQRLVRTLDPSTRQMRATTDAEKAMLQKLFSTVADPSLIPTSFDQVGVAVPSGESSGYKGRVGVYEAIFMDEAMGVFLRDNPGEGEIAHAAERQGFLTMTQDGALKALAGITTLEEVADVVGLPRE